MEKPERITISTKLPKKLYQAAKKLAVDEESTISALLERALRQYVTPKT